MTERHELSRRDFVRGIGAAAVGATALGSTLARGAEPNPYGGFRVGLQSYSLRGFPFAEAVKLTQKMGLHHLELFPGHVAHQPPTQMSKEDAKKLMSDSGISADAYGVVGFTKDEAAARKIFEFAQFMGLRSISASPDKDSFDMLDKLVEEFRIPIAIHNHGPADKWGKPEVILEAIKDHHKFIGICCDCGHYLRAGVDPLAAIKMLKGRVYGFHMKDFVDEKTEVTAGDGKLKIAEILKEARDQNFHGICALEYELDPKDPIAGIEKGLANMRAAIKSIA